MKKVQVIGTIILCLSVIGIALSHFIGPFGDWVLRIIGIILIISMVVVVFSTVRLFKKK